MLYYVYAIIGMQIWAGKMTRDNPALEGSDYAEEDYFRNNFDSFDSALVVLFELMAVFSWNDIRRGARTTRAWWKGTVVEGVGAWRRSTGGMIPLRAWKSSPLTHV